MKNIFTILSVFIISVAQPLKTMAQVNSTDSLALVALYNSTNGAGWTNHSGWLAGPVVNWNGVSLNGTRVSTLILNGNNLVGTLPSSLGNIGGLTDLELGNNQLSGSIPTSLGNLTNLQSIFLGNNQLSGNIPTTIGSLTNIAFLDLSVNQLSGSIPYSLGSLVNLNTLYLNNNNLSGTIPGTLGYLINLGDLELNYNQLSGTITDSLQTLVNIETLYLSNNQLSGSIPSSLSNLINLYDLKLSSNLLTGSIPTSLGTINSLSNLALDSNLLTGNIPAALNGSSNLNNVNLSHNQLSGSIPSSLGSSNIYTMDLSYNQLSGTVPLSFTNLTNAFTYINNNSLTFNGLEPVATALAGSLIDSAQSLLSLQLNGAVLSVSAGGTLTNNTYKWYNYNALVATITGDSTYNSTAGGHYSVVITNSIVSNLSDLTLYSDTQVVVVLPLTYLNFTGTLVNNNSLLQWQTANEVNTSYFNVQRSVDGINFTNIGKVNAAGNSSASQSYNYTDDLSSLTGQPSALFYRLQEIDKSGSNSISKIVKIELNKQLSSISIYPNPVKDLLNINVGNNSGTSLITVFDMNGNSLIQQTQTVQQNSSISINAVNLSKGIYIIQETINGSTSQQKFIKE